MLYKFCFNKAVKIVEIHSLKSFKTMLLQSSIYNFFSKIPPSLFLPSVLWTIFLKLWCAHDSPGDLAEMQIWFKVLGWELRFCISANSQVMQMSLVWGPHFCRKGLAVSLLGWPVGVTWFPWWQKWQLTV